MTAAAVRTSALALGRERDGYGWTAPLAALSLHGALLAWLAGPDRTPLLPPAPVLRVQWLPQVAPPAPVLAPAPMPVPVVQAARVPVAARPARPMPRQLALAEPVPATQVSGAGPDSAPEPLAAAAPVIATAALAAPASRQPEPLSTPARFDAAYLANPEPPYPPAAKLRGEAGTVRLRVRVGADGRPEAVEVAQSSGHARLDRAAENTVRQHWRFVPAQRGGTPVANTVIVPIAFLLQ